MIQRLWDSGSHSADQTDQESPALYGAASIAQYGDYNVGLTTEELGFDSWQGREILFFFKVFIPALGPTHPSV